MALWWEGAQRETALFAAAPSVGHFFALFGYLSAPLLTLLVPLYVALFIHRCVFGIAPQPEDDSDGEEAPQLVPLRDDDAPQGKDG